MAPVKLTSDQFRYAWSNSSKWACRFSEVHVFPSGSDAFPSASSEESIHILRGDVTGFRSFAHFCVQSAMLVYGYADLELKWFGDCKFAHIDSSDVKRRIGAQCDRIINERMGLDASEAYGDGVLLNDEWCDLAIAWQVSNTFAAYFWSTTA